MLNTNSWFVAQQKANVTNAKQKAHTCAIRIHAIQRTNITWMHRIILSVASGVHCSLSLLTQSIVTLNFPVPLKCANSDSGGIVVFETETDTWVRTLAIRCKICSLRSRWFPQAQSIVAVVPTLWVYVSNCVWFLPHSSAVRRPLRPKTPDIDPWLLRSSDGGRDFHKILEEIRELRSKFPVIGIRMC